MFVAAAGSNQTPSVRTTSTAFTYNPSTGDLTVNGNVTAYSDERLKTEIETIQNALNTVSRMRGVSFLRGGIRGVGVVAQEMQKVLPEVVLNGEYLSVAYSNIVAVLIEAMKEQKAIMEKQEARIQRLEILVDKHIE